MVGGWLADDYWVELRDLLVSLLLLVFAASSFLRLVLDQLG